MMKMNKFALPFSITTLCLLMSACGGEKNIIHEDPTTIADGTTAMGCTNVNTSACFEFVMEYPIAGIQYTCSSDKVNTFATQVEQNIVKGGCNKNDRVTFFLNATDNVRIELGHVEIPDLGNVSITSSPVHLTLLDMAQGLTGQKAQSFDPDDSTVKVALGLTKIFQAIGNQKTNSNEIGDIQLVELREDSLKDLDKITAKVDLSAFQDGSYANILKPWIDVTGISDAQAFAVLEDAANMSLSALYQVDQGVFNVTNGLLGSSSANANKMLTGTVFLLSDRQGFTQGYGIQWIGTPTLSSSWDLVLRTNPIAMYAASQLNWLDPATKRLGTGASKFRFITAQDDTLFINQGRLINDYGIAGTNAFYQYLTNQNSIIQEDLGKWSQTSGSDQFTGSVDVVKANPISYLDRRVFPSSTNVSVGAKYYFPLYATLNFKFYDEEGTLKTNGVNLGIVIDEHGDIRTDVKDWSSSDLSGQCGELEDPTLAEPIDNFGTHQYRIGTVSATNYQPNQTDMTISPRIILSGSHFGMLDGVALGLNNVVSTSSESSQVIAVSSGVKINLFNLLRNNSVDANSINLSSRTDGIAEWANIYNAYKKIYVTANTDYAATEAEKAQIKRITGSASIKLNTSCYEVKTKE